MNRDHFTDIFEETVTKSRDSLLRKNKEYGQEQDIFRAFTQAGHLQDIEPHQALLGMLAKHTTSIYDMGSVDILDHTLHQWEEKIMDHINYLILLRAMILVANSSTEALNSNHGFKAPTLEQCIDSVNKQRITTSEYIKPLADKILTFCIDQHISDPDIVLINGVGMDASVIEGMQVLLNILNEDHEEVVYITPEL